MVWIFVAGLTGFELFKGISMKSGAFVSKTTKDDKRQLSRMLVHCLYEAQINEFEYSTIFEGISNVQIAIERAPLEKYALGYCIARSPPTILWDVELDSGSSDSLIPSLYNLSTLELRPWQPIQEADVIMLLDKLSTSKVSNLIIGLHHDILEKDQIILAMSKLINPLSGTLQNLTIFQYFQFQLDIDKLIAVRTSLCTLLYNSELHISLLNPSPLALLETNTCLTHITIECFSTKEYAESIASILLKNTTLRCLILKWFDQNVVEPLKIITRNIEANTTLQRLEFHAINVETIIQELSQLKNDPRIHYHNY